MLYSIFFTIHIFSLDIDFIHGIIHGWSCKNYYLFTVHAIFSHETGPIHPVFNTMNNDITVLEHRVFQEHLQALKSKNS